MPRPNSEILTARIREDSSRNAAPPPQRGERYFTDDADSVAADLVTDLACMIRTALANGPVRSYRKLASTTGYSEKYLRQLASCRIKSPWLSTVARVMFALGRRAEIAEDPTPA